MEPGARTPEELETLLEDAFVTRDREMLGELFDERAVLVIDAREAAVEEARGREAIARIVAGMWERRETYIADARRIVRARETALVVGAAGAGVVRRGGDGAWRYAVVLLSPPNRASESIDTRPERPGPQAVEAEAR
jgi:hypothetical protein